MRFKNDVLIEYFINCNFHFDKHSNLNNTLKITNYDTDYYNLYSYNELIAEKFLDTNEITIYPKTAKYNIFFSMTTSRHVMKLIRYCQDYDIPFTFDEEE